MVNKIDKGQIVINHSQDSESITSSSSAGSPPVDGAGSQSAANYIVTTAAGQFHHHTNGQFHHHNAASPQTISHNHNNYLPVHYLHELPQADEERLERLFKKLDRDGNGRIDIHDLSSALKEFGISSAYAEVSGFLCTGFR